MCLVRDAATVYEVKYPRTVGYRTVIEITDSLKDLSKVFFTCRNCASGFKEEIASDPVVRILSNIQWGWWVSTNVFIENCLDGNVGFCKGT